MNIRIICNIFYGFFELFNVAMGLRQEWRRVYRERYTAHLAAVAAAVNTVREGEVNGV